MLVVGVRPRPIEDILAVGIRLEVHGQSAENTLPVPAEQVHRPPAAPPADAARPLQRTQELQVEERKIRRLDGPPRRLIHLPDAKDPPYPHHAAPDDAVPASWCLSLSRCDLAPFSIAPSVCASMSHPESTLRITREHNLSGRQRIAATPRSASPSRRRRRCWRPRRSRRPGNRPRRRRKR